MTMEVLGMSLLLVLLFVGFGLIIGILFGFFGMGGSFLVTPALLVLGYPAKVAVGSGLAFVFGTAVIGALRHRDLGQVDYKLAALIITGMTVGIEIGKRAVLLLERAGLSDIVISVAYVGLLVVVGLQTLRDSMQSESDDGDTLDLSNALERVRIPPMLTFTGGTTVSLWVTLGIGLGIGILSGFLGVGGGFLLMPTMLYGFGVPAEVAIGTSVLQITIPGSFGAFVYAQEGAVNVPVVASLLLGSALGARIGAAATELIDGDDIKGYFAAMLLAGSVAVASKKLSAMTGIAALKTVSMVLIFGAAILVSGAIIYSSVRVLRGQSVSGRPSTN
ncbi:sulfite exporter TauE/SafE family protein [Haladaptatus sp. W1]|uniref:sulfite exporter TauE/SafE family protein n=1 Tax=Haladaptatus sp. W1 TaxID=1897478 RepID=UPI0009F74279|nr:sulfite exporter TauE/SafE family protein [Haladaptatus sp. W1]